ncbi:MAG: ABC transporter permease [Antricoccus sp.]
MKRRNPSLIIGGILVALVVIMAVVSFFWTPHNPILNDGTAKFAPMWGKYFLGTDKFGRDELSRLMLGARTTLLVGIVSVSIALIIGVPLGIWSAMSRRVVGNLVMRGNDLLLAFPALLLAIMLAAIYGSGTVVAMIAIGIATIPTFARVSRAGAMQIIQNDYILAARAAGHGKFAIARRHILPNIGSLVIVQASIAFATAILAEAALSYLGLGTPPPNPTWGNMLFDSQDTLYKAVHLGLIPGIAIALAVLGFNLLGDGLRDRLDATLADVR